MENNIVNIEDKITQQTINTSIYTIEDVKEKLEKDKEDFPQWEHQYMRERLIEKAQQDQHMFDAIMQEHKSYKAGFDYVTKMAQKMLKERKGNQAIALDDKQVLTYLIEYFFIDDKEEYEKKLEQEKKKEENKEPETKICPYCLTEIKYHATRCPNCTSELVDENAKV